MINQINSLIENLGVETSDITMNTQIGEEGIGFDSQEIVELTCLMEKHFNMKLPNNFLQRDKTIGDVVQFFTDQESKSSPFEGHAESSLIINCPVDVAFEAIYEMEKWPENLPHVERIETLYNDGMYQEFLMDVLSDTGLIKVRSIRRCTPKEMITFFQPSPPVFLKHHCGGWLFKACENGCKVKTWHDWNLMPGKSAELFPEKDGLTTEKRIEKVLLSHAELALQTWKNILEKKS